MLMYSSLPIQKQCVAAIDDEVCVPITVKMDPQSAAPGPSVQLSPSEIQEAQ